MARKGSQPALYELIRGHGPVASPQSASGRPRELPISPGVPTAAPPAPPRTVRVPVGYVWIAVAAVLAIVVASYLYGFQKGERNADLRRAQQHIDEMNAAAQLPPADPLTAGKLPPSLAGGEGRNNSGVSPGASKDQGTGRPKAPSAGDAGEDLGPAPGGDPRQDGLNYFVIAHTANRNGEAMVEFCRKNGLDAHMVPDDNGELRLVIVLPGFASGERQSGPVKALETKIRSVGLKWKNAARGNRDFGDAYPKKHTAPKSG